MSAGEPQDRAATRRLVRDVRDGEKPVSYRDYKYRGRICNWLRHQIDSEGACIDSMLVKGATLKHIVSRIKKIPQRRNYGKRQSPEERINSHFGHLRDEHKVEVEPDSNGVYSMRV